MIPTVQEKRENAGVRSNDRLKLLNLFAARPFLDIATAMLGLKNQLYKYPKCFLQCKIRPGLLKHFQKKLQTIHLYIDAEKTALTMHSVKAWGEQIIKKNLENSLKITLWKYIAQKIVRKIKKEERKATGEDTA